MNKVDHEFITGHGPLSHMFERYILDKLVSMRVSL